MSNFHWTNIISFQSSQYNAFEELICQLADKEVFNNKKDFTRVGTPDAGKECYITLSDNSEICFQAKWFLSALEASQWKQIEKSFKTALEKHPNMIKYYITIPLDRADGRNPKKSSSMEKWYKNINKWKKFAKSEYNRNIKFIYWGNFELIQRLIKKEKEDIKDFFSPPSLSKNEINYLKTNILFDRNHSFKRYKIIDLFSGIGGTRLGFRNAFKSNADFIFSSEIDKFAQQTYYENYKEMPFGDITQIDEKCIPPFDILLVSVPLLAFSIAGKRKVMMR